MRVTTSQARTIVLTVALACWAPAAVAQQDLGHRILGGLGLRAGSLAPPGVYVGDRALFYSAHSLIDRNGRELPVGLDLNAIGNAVGVQWVLQLPLFGTRFGVAVSVPFASVRLNTPQPQASIDRFGLGDVYVRPLNLGWTFPRFDLSFGFAFYAPTGQFAPRQSGSVSSGQWTQELSAGGTVWFDAEKTWHLSALASGDLYAKKVGVDITRGATVQVQGGAGKRLFGFIDVGLVGYGLWQVANDTGSALPAALVGARDQAAGLGAEVDVLIAAIRTQLVLRYEHDLYARSRPSGGIVVLGLTWVAWAPERRP